MCNLVGRKQEIKELNKRLKSEKAEFIAVYGRRRVGKTFLIDEVFKNNMTFQHTGLSPFDKKKRTTMKDQLQNFYFTLIRNGYEGESQPKSWLEAFFMLEQLLESKSKTKRQVVFIDELPWLDTPRSGFLTAFEAFWNGWGCHRANLCLVVCGSATSWMVDNLINSKGGLYGRLTLELKLTPFTLAECAEYYKSVGVKMTKYDVAQSYMIVGGIPYYMSYFNPEYSLAQNIDQLFFAKNAKLGDEFNRLFRSIFTDADNCMKIIRFLSTRHCGYSRDEIAKATQLIPNGAFTNLLKALIASDFVTRYTPYGENRRNEYYKLSDPFCWFWLHFKEGKNIGDEAFWLHNSNHSIVFSWRGVAFEELCMNHINTIKSALGISGVSTQVSAYTVRGDGDNNGMQIDLIIDRQDGVLNVCEMKYYKDEFRVDKIYEEKLRKRQSQIQQQNPRKNIHLTLISSYGCVQNEYSGIFQSQVCLDDIL